MIKLFIIDDSALVRNEFKKIFEPVRDIEIIGTAPNPVDAFEVFKRVWNRSISARWFEWFRNWNQR